MKLFLTGKIDAQKFISVLNKSCSSLEVKEVFLESAAVYIDIVLLLKLCQ